MPETTTTTTTTSKKVVTEKQKRHRLKKHGIQDERIKLQVSKLK